MLFACQGRSQCKAQKIIAKKAKKYTDEKKLVAYLARQGFSYDEIKRAILKEEF